MYRHQRGDDLLYTVWLKIGMQVAQKSEYLKARFGLQRGRTNGLTINGWWKKHVRTIQIHSFLGHSDDNCYDVKTLSVLPYRGSTTMHTALPCHSWPSTLLESRQIFKLDFVVSNLTPPFRVGGRLDVRKIGWRSVGWTLLWPWTWSSRRSRPVLAPLIFVCRTAGRLCLGSSSETYLVAVYTEA